MVYETAYRVLIICQKIGNQNLVFLYLIVFNFCSCIKILWKKILFGLPILIANISILAIGNAFSN